MCNMEVSVEALMIANLKAEQVPKSVEKVIEDFRNQKTKLNLNEVNGAYNLERIDTIQEANSMQEI